MNAEVNLQIQDPDRVTAARSQVYKILSDIFSYPADAQHEAFVSSGAVVALREAIAELPFAIPASESLEQLDAEVELNLIYTRLFDSCTGQPALSLYEKDYSRNDTKQIWEELIRFYEHFGLNYNLEQCKEWPDHISTQLEFLHYLTFLEAGSPSHLTGTYIAAEGDFLDRHLAKWAPQFSQKMAGISQNTPYGYFTQVLEEFVKGEQEFVQRQREDQ